jgi:hypothetical protein
MTRCGSFPARLAMASVKTAAGPSFLKVSMSFSPESGQSAARRTLFPVAVTRAPDPISPEEMLRSERSIYFTKY